MQPETVSIGSEALPESLEGLYREHWTRLVRTATRLVGDSAAAEDAVQETWLKAVRLYGSALCRPTPAWLYRVTMNNCYDRLRANRRTARTTRPVEEVPGSHRLPYPTGRTEAPDDPETAVIRAELVRAVTTAVETLPPLLREAILLREYGQLKYAEIAEVIGCPIGTVMSRLHMARRSLRKALAPYLEGPETSLGHGEGGRRE